jgi:hypothetical protein
MTEESRPKRLDQILSDFCRRDETASEDPLIAVLLYKKISEEETEWSTLSKEHREELLVLGQCAPFISKFTITDQVHVERRSSVEDLWAVTRFRTVRTRPTKRFPTGVWVYEPSPSNRTPAFIRHTRLPKIEALKLALTVIAENPEHYTSV